MRFRRTRSRGLISAVLVVTALVAACGSDGSRQVVDELNAEAADCSEGIDRYDGDETAVVLGCAELDDGRVIELLAGRPRGGAGPCLNISGMGQDRARGCGFAPLERVPPQTGAILRDGTAQATRTSQIEVYGGLSAEATAVQLWHGIEDSGAADRVEASVIRVDSEPALERAGIAEPFGYFIALVPAGSERCVAIALDSDGEGIGANGCEPYGGLARDAFMVGADYHDKP